MCWNLKLLNSAHLGADLHPMGTQQHRLGIDRLFIIWVPRPPLLYWGGNKGEGRKGKGEGRREGRRGRETEAETERERQIF